jgi:hypothetical protein
MVGSPGIVVWLVNHIIPAPKQSFPHPHGFAFVPPAAASNQLGGHCIAPWPATSTAFWLAIRKSTAAAAIDFGIIVVGRCSYSFFLPSIPLATP